MAATTHPPTPRTTSGSLPKTMRALIKSTAGPGLTLVTDRPLPSGSTGKPGEPGPNDVLVRVHKAGVCGTDRHIYEWDDWAAGRIPVGIVTGHEFVGVVVRVGSAVEQVKPGDRVSAESHIAPGHDYNSLIGDAHVARNMQILGVDRDGIFADYAMIPQSHIWPVNQDIPDKWAAIFDPFGNAVHTVMSAGVSVKSVLITGAGIIGLMAVAVAKAAGAQQLFVAEPDPRRRELALKLGAKKAYNPLPKDKGGQGDDWVKEIKSTVQGEGVDVLLEMSGNASAIVQGFRAMRQGGTAALLGIPSKSFNFDITEHIIFKGADVLGINGRQMWQTWFQMERLILAGAVNLDDIITHELPFEDYNRAFELMQSGEGIKIVLDLNGPTR
ncbi:MAG: L-threonine 3-dehydrogenase [Phycisphaerales bacterium]|nr:L-threonine 3-dehydrogenase [Phycisphaerales bacterium]